MLLCKYILSIQIIIGLCKYKWHHLVHIWITPIVWHCINLSIAMLWNLCTPSIDMHKPYCSATNSCVHAITQSCVHMFKQRICTCTKQWIYIHKHVYDNTLKHNHVANHMQWVQHSIPWQCYILLHAHTYIHVFKNAHTCVPTHAYTYMHTWLVCIYKHIHIHMPIHIWLCRCLTVHMCTCMQSCSCTHTYTHNHHTHVHSSYTHIFWFSSNHIIQWYTVSW